MNKYNKPDIIESKMGKNPFIASLVIPVTKSIIPNTFKQEEGIWVSATTEYEKTPFVKLYRSKERRLIKAGLSGSALKLLEWIRDVIPHGQDYLWINKIMFMEETGMSLNTYKKAIEELCMTCILNKVVKYDCYWINPDFFFFGSRVNKFPSNVVKVE